MNPVQTALLAVPAAATGFLGALSFSPPRGLGPEMATVWSRTELKPLADQNICKRWAEEMEVRKSRIDSVATQEKASLALKDGLKEKIPDLEKLEISLQELKDDLAKQRQIDALGNWQNDVNAILKPIDDFNLGEIESKLGELKKSLENPGANEGNVAALEKKSQEIKESIDNKRKELKEQPNWQKQLEKYRQDYDSKMNPTKLEN